MSITIRVIDGKRYRCRDVGCDDFEGASLNRERIRTHSHMIWWIWYREMIRNWPIKKPLPWWIPQGALPKVGKYERRFFSDYGIYEIGDDGLLKI